MGEEWVGWGENGGWVVYSYEMNINKKYIRKKI